MQFNVRSADWQTDREAIRHVREQVFVIEQNVDPGLEWDGLDAGCEHAVVALEDGRVVGTGRLHAQGDVGKIGRMAVLEEFRGCGAGAAILTFLVRRARELGLRQALLHAQTHALAFYLRAGFEARGPEFDEAGIPHRKMTMTLKSDDEPEGLSGDQTTVLDRQLLATAEAVLDGALQVTAMAARELAIFSHELAGQVFRDPLFLEAVRQLAISGPHARVRVLVSHPAAAARHATQFLGLIRQLGSHMAIRAAGPQHRDRQVTYIIADDRALIYHPSEDASEALLEPLPGTARHYLNQFEDMWEHGVAHPELRTIAV